MLCSMFFFAAALARSLGSLLDFGLGSCETYLYTVRKRGDPHQSHVFCAFRQLSEDTFSCTGSAWPPPGPRVSNTDPPSLRYSVVSGVYFAGVRFALYFLRGSGSATQLTEHFFPYTSAASDSRYAPSGEVAQL
jgi:hypothetical protein